jgi:hypothetical protein
MECRAARQQLQSPKENHTMTGSIPSDPRKSRAEFTQPQGTADGPIPATVGRHQHPKGWSYDHEGDALWKSSASRWCRTEAIRQWWT